MRISDWSSDVCSSDLARRLENFAGDEFGHGAVVERLSGPRFLIVPAVPLSLAALRAQERALHVEIGRASCRERVCWYVSISVVAVSLKKKKKTMIID